MSVDLVQPDLHAKLGLLTTLQSMWSCINSPFAQYHTRWLTILSKLWVNLLACTSGWPRLSHGSFCCLLHCCSYVLCPVLPAFSLALNAKKYKKYQSSPLSPSNCIDKYSYQYHSMSNNGVLLDLYIAWEARLDAVTEEPFPSWVCAVHISSFESDVFSVPSCPRSLQKGGWWWVGVDDGSHVWVILEILQQKCSCSWYSEFVIPAWWVINWLTYQSHATVTCVFVPENWNVQGQYMTSPIMSTACWNELDGSPEPYWVSENNINHVTTDVLACHMMTPFYHVWVDLKENHILVSACPLCWCYLLITADWFSDHELLHGVMIS